MGQIHIVQAGKGVRRNLHIRGRNSDYLIQRQAVRIRTMGLQQLTEDILAVDRVLQSFFNLGQRELQHLVRLLDRRKKLGEQGVSQKELVR